MTTTTPAAAPMSAEQRALLKRAAEQQIDDFLRSVGVTDPAEITDESGARFLTQGSSSGFVQIVEADEQAYLQVVVPVMALPADHGLILPLMRELLEFNLMIAGAARLGIRNAQVWVNSTYPLLELRKADFGRLIQAAFGLANELDEQLQAKYGGTTRTRASADKAAGGKRKARRAGPANA